MVSGFVTFCGKKKNTPAPILDSKGLSIILSFILVISATSFLISAEILLTNFKVRPGISTHHGLDWAFLHRL